MKKIILSLLIAATAIAAVPCAKADVVIVRHRHHRRHAVVVKPRMVLVPGHWEGHWWHRHWVPAHYVPA